MSDINIEMKVNEGFNLTTPILYSYNGVGHGHSVFMIIKDNKSQLPYRTLSLDFGAMQGGREFVTLEEAYLYLKKQKNVRFLRLDATVYEKWDSDVQFKFEQHLEEGV